MTEIYLSVLDTASRLGVNKKTVLRWIHSGRLPGAYQSHPDLTTSPYRIPLSAVQLVELKRRPDLLEVV